MQIMYLEKDVHLKTKKSQCSATRGQVWRCTASSIQGLEGRIPEFKAIWGYTVIHLKKPKPSELNNKKTNNLTQDKKLMATKQMKRCLTQKTLRYIEEIQNKTTAYAGVELIEQHIVIHCCAS